MVRLDFDWRENCWRGDFQRTLRNSGFHGALYALSACLVRPLKVLRESGLSLAEVAKKTGLATTTVFSIEQGDGRVSMSQFFCVANLFGFQPDIMLAKFCRRERAMSGLRKRARSQNTNGNKAAVKASS